MIHVLLIAALQNAQPPEAPAAEGPEPLVTDRPDVTESTPTIPAGRVQLEGGYTCTAGEDLLGHNVGELLFRVGVGDRLELRLGAASLAFDTDGGVSGATDASIGVKLRLLEEKGPRPAFSIILQSSVPVHDSDFGGAEPEPEFKLLWSKDLPRGLSLAGNINAAAPVADDGGRYFEPAVSVSLGVPLADRLGLFVEYFAFVPIGNHETSTHYANAGLTFLISPDLQFDIRAGAGLNDHADDFFAGAGFAVRF
ncbi:hypothetical protein PHYC_02381 [Phycisphaerales bacterium]|nr:hypothetical protein PHYC_02381 [Phycisphaerales bacterium]